ncbi:uncharacterized protein LOC116301386 [Actinia tenebrosa]|uniref:Uncharacterized protein LOC116301386 n=1 Tax=Actinia tenebrosa TaxID=6105 RepID=A0A6P8IHY0_ACTTE|nr:uncharacterized protein LOC116301386 [Actinia tenebrosa]
MPSQPYRSVAEFTAYKILESQMLCGSGKLFSAIKEMKALSVLDVYSTQLREEVLCSLPQKLKGIDVGYCESITKDGLTKFIWQQPNLVYVGLAGLKDVICQEVLDTLSICNLKYLDRSESHVLGSLSTFFRDQSSLSELSLQGRGLALRNLNHFEFPLCDHT